MRRLVDRQGHAGDRLALAKGGLERIGFFVDDQVQRTVGQGRARRATYLQRAIEQPAPTLVAVEHPIHAQPDPSPAKHGNVGPGGDQVQPQPGAVAYRLDVGLQPFEPDPGRRRCHLRGGDHHAGARRSDPTDRDDQDQQEDEAVA